MIVASLIFSMAVGSLTSTWIMHARITSQTRYRIVAVYLAQQVCEEATARGYWFVNDVAADYNASPGIEMVVENGDSIAKTLYKVTVDVSTSSLGSGLKNVAVKVAWHEPNGDREVRCDTILARVGG